MALVIALIFLVLQIASSASIPSDTRPPELLSSLDVPAVQGTSAVDGPLVAVKGDEEEDGEPIALLVGKNVKRIIRRKGQSDAKDRVSRHRGQPKDSSHLIDSHDWSQVSGLDHILDPVSFEDPEDVELKTAIAQLLKEVAAREEKRKKKQKLNSNEADLNVLDDNDKGKAQSRSADHSDETKLSEDDVIDDENETFAKVDDHQDADSGAIDDFDEEDYPTGSGDEYGDSDLSDGDFESSENDYDYVEDREHKVKNDQKILDDDDQSDQFSKEQHHDIDRFQDKINHDDNHVSREVIEAKGDSKNVEENKEHLDDSENITLEKSQDAGKDKLENLDDNHETANENDDSISRTSKHTGHRNHDHERSHHNEHQNNDVTNPQEFDNNSNNDGILRNGVQEDSQSSHNHDDIIKANEKENEKHEDLINENNDEKNHGKDENENKLDKTEDQSSHDVTNSRQESQNHVTFNHDGEDAEQHLDGEEPDDTADQSPKHLNYEENNRRNNIDSKTRELKNDNQIDLKSKLNNLVEDITIKKTTEDKSSEIKNRIADAAKEPQTDDDHKNNDKKHHSEYDSVEIRRYHHLQRRHPSRESKHDRISKSYRTSSRNRPIKQYTLSFFLRK